MVKLNGLFFICNLIEIDINQTGWTSYLKIENIWSGKEFIFVDQIRNYIQQMVDRLH